MKKLLISLLVLTISATTIQAKRTKVKFTDYKVQSGDTLFLIARKHHTTTEEVRNTNKLEKDQLIRVGQELRVPTDTYFPRNRVTSKKTPKKGMTEYTIEAGDTLFTIARKHHTTTKEVLEANEMERGAMIRIGQSLKVPTNTYFPDKEKKKPVKIVKKAPKKGIADYVIKSGDTIFTIARKHHTTTKELRDANGMKRNSIIRVGKKLKVPTNTYFPDGVKTVEKTKIVKKEKAKETYEVKSGDTLFSIARKHHVTLKTIMALNSMKAGSIIKIGQKLKVSNKVSYVAKKKKVKKVKYVTKKYKVKRGDTLSRIAKRYKVSVKELRKLNKLNRKSSLRIGKVLAVGKSPIKIKKTKRTYKVRRGDTLWLIAKKHKTTVKKLRKLNKLSRRSKLYKGMVLAVDGKIKKSKTKQYVAKKKTSKKTTNRTKYASKSKSKSSKKRLSEAMAILNGKRSSKSRSSGSNSKVIRTAKRYLGTRYVWGAQGPNRFDCSGFTQYVIRKSKGVRLPRVSRKQAYYGKYVSRQNLRAGDLVFFDTSRRRRGYVNHVGIYIGGNKFIHASSAKHRVVITSLNRPFYRSRFKWGRRVN